MKAEKLAGLEPASVFAYFEKICSIPHGSGNTKAISDYLASFARARNLRYVQAFPAALRQVRMAVSAY